mmetsp:Transcript_81079/g.213849  ORF Transcript_81079/g.213849 Transcript_81079/m.213849 type:complete len:234 (+) Transcript_81079:560-1261(+)
MANPTAHAMARVAAHGNATCRSAAGLLHSFAWQFRPECNAAHQPPKHASQRLRRRRRQLQRMGQRKTQLKWLPRRAGDPRRTRTTRKNQAMTLAMPRASLCRRWTRPSAWLTRKTCSSIDARRSLSSRVSKRSRTDDRLRPPQTQEHFRRWERHPRRPWLLDCGPSGIWAQRRRSRWTRASRTSRSARPWRRWASSKALPAVPAAVARARTSPARPRPPRRRRLGTRATKRAS